MESTSYVLSFRTVFFYLVTTGWIFDISLCENSNKKKSRPSSRVRARAPPVQHLLRGGYKRGLRAFQGRQRHLLEEIFYGAEAGTGFVNSLYSQEEDNGVLSCRKSEGSGWSGRMP